MCACVEHILNDLLMNNSAVFKVQLHDCWWLYIHESVIIRRSSQLNAKLI